MNVNNIYLIGHMGAGKSSVGKILAKLTNKTFCDSDSEIENQTGVSINWIFEVEGEAGFREREEKMIHTLCEQNNIVLSTGGGCIIKKSTREILASTGVVVYLKVSLDTQLKRTAHRKSRPLINVPDPASQLKKLSNTREPLYESIANLTYDTNKKSPKTIATEIVEAINKRAWQ